MKLNKEEKSLEFKANDNYFLECINTTISKIKKNNKEYDDSQLLRMSIMLNTYVYHNKKELSKNEMFITTQLLKERYNKLTKQIH